MVRGAAARRRRSCAQVPRPAGLDPLEGGVQVGVEVGREEVVEVVDHLLLEALDERHGGLEGGLQDHLVNKKCVTFVCLCRAFRNLGNKIYVCWFICIICLVISDGISYARRAMLEQMPPHVLQGPKGVSRITL